MYTNIKFNHIQTKYTRICSEMLSEANKTELKRRGFYERVSESILGL
jgi:hypothetical protein